MFTRYSSEMDGMRLFHKYKEWDFSWNEINLGERSTYANYVGIKCTFGKFIVVLVTTNIADDLGFAAVP